MPDMAEAMGMQHINRRQFPDRGAPPYIVPKPGLKYFDAYDWDYSSSGWKTLNNDIKKLLADRPKG